MQDDVFKPNSFKEQKLIIFEQYFFFFFIFLDLREKKCYRTPTRNYISFSGAKIFSFRLLQKVNHFERELKCLQIVLGTQSPDFVHIALYFTIFSFWYKFFFFEKSQA
jgi:hypothetical protein